MRREFCIKIVRLDRRTFALEYKVWSREVCSTEFVKSTQCALCDWRVVGERPVWVTLNYMSSLVTHSNCPGAHGNRFACSAFHLLNHLHSIACDRKLNLVLRLKSEDHHQKPEEFSVKTSRLNNWKLKLLQRPLQGLCRRTGGHFIGNLWTNKLSK